MGKKKTEKQLAKEKAWAAFSIYIRRRDCIRFTGDPDRGMCVTCKRPYKFKQLQAGHFIGGRTNAVLFDERIVFSQCYGCNVGRSGNYLEYFYFMEQEVGRDMIDQLVAEAKQRTIKYTLQDYYDLAQQYTERAAKLLTTPVVRPSMAAAVFG